MDAPELKQRYAAARRFVFCGVDVHKSDFVCVARGYDAESGDSGLIDASTLHSFADVDKWANDCGASVGEVCMDSGFRTLEVYQAAYRYRFIPTKGGKIMRGLLNRTGPFSVLDGSSVPNAALYQQNAVPLVIFDATKVKDLLHSMIIGASPFSWWLPQNIYEHLAYIEQMQSQHSDGVKWRQIRPGADDHYWDAEVLTLVAAIFSGVIIIPEVDHDRTGARAETGTDARKG
jgi:hypothetical protein